MFEIGASDLGRCSRNESLSTGLDGARSQGAKGTEFCAKITLHRDSDADRLTVA